MENNYNYDQIENLLRDENHLYELYDIKEEVNFQNIIKLFGYTRDKYIPVIISKQDFEFENQDLFTRTTSMIKLVESNVILIENIWIEDKDTSK